MRDLEGSWPEEFITPTPPTDPGTSPCLEISSLFGAGERARHHAWEICPWGTAGSLGSEAFIKFLQGFRAEAVRI